jgi:hypothetical protein
MGQCCAPLRFDVYTVNGEVIHFNQDDPRHVDQILDDVLKQRLFTERSLTIASLTSVSSFATQDIEMIKFHFEGPKDFHPILGMTDIREIPRTEFQDRYLALQPHERLRLREVPEGQFLTTFGEIHLKSGNILFLELVIQKRSPRDHMIAFKDAFLLPMLPFHVRDSGIGVLNTGAVTRLTVHPGPSMLPPAAWHADPSPGR